MAFFNRAKGLTGLNPLAYMGQEGAEGGNTTVPLVCYPDDPGPTDWKNFNLMTLWLNTSNNNLWYLASLAGNQALWLMLSGGAGDVLELTGNTGGPVFPLAGNINVVGDGTTITIAGVPGTHTLTASLIGATGPAISTLTGNSGGAVGPTAGNINTVGDGIGITIAGNPGTSTLTASIINGGTHGAVTGLKADDGLTAFPLLGLITVHSASANLTTTAATANTVTLTLGGAVAQTFPTDSGTATPSAGALTIHGGTNITTSGSGSTVTISSSFVNSSFSAYLSADLTNATGNGAVVGPILFNTADFNVNSNYNTATGLFTATVAGIYHFDATVTISNLSNAMLVGIASIIVSGTGPSVGGYSFIRNSAYGTADNGGAGLWRYSGGTTVSLAVGDTVQVNTVVTSGGMAGNTATINGPVAGSPATYFSGFRIS